MELLTRCRQLIGETREVTASRNDKINVALLVELGSNVESACQRLSESSEKYNNVDDGEYQAVYRILRDCEKALTDRITHLRQPKTSVKEADASKRSRAVDDRETRRSTAVKGNEDRMKSMLTTVATRLVQANAKVERLLKSGARPSEGVARELKKLQERYRVLLEVSDGILGKARVIKKESASLVRKYDASVKLAESLAERLRKQQVRDFVAEAVESKPALRHSVKLLLECRTVDEVADKIKTIKSTLTPERLRDVTPAEEVVESVHVPAGGGSGKIVQKKPTNLSEALYRQKGM